jgi:alanine dehydrogenase
VIVGIPREVKDNEFRVAATPEGVRELARAGHDVILEAGAGTGSALSDELFTAAGAEILPDAGAVFDTSDMILKVKEPQPEE